MPVYLDHNATTPLSPIVLEAMMPYMSGIYGNPSSVHRFGRLTRSALEQARNQVAALVDADVNQVVFTSGGTEANNLAITGTLTGLPVGRFAVGATEHACLLEPARRMKKLGWQLDMIPVNTQGQIEVDNLPQIIRPKASSTETQLMSVMAANNETGVLQDLKGLVKQAREINSDILVHSDACQMAGKLSISFRELGLNLMSLSSHKLYGPQGVGALIVDRKIDLQAIIIGGGQEATRRSGTENLAAIVGFGAAAELAGQQMQQRAEHTRQLRQQLHDALKQRSGVVIFSDQVECLPNTLQFSMKGIDGETLLMQLDRHGFAVSSGSACHSEQTEPSHVLLAMGVDEQTARGAIRVSFGEQNTQQDVTRFIDALDTIRQQFAITV